MKNKVIIITTLAFFCLAGCKNPIMETWWVKDEPSYIPIVKMVPQVTTQTVYETVIQYQTIHDTVFVQLPPQVIHDTIIQEVTKEVPVYIYETIIEKVPEVVYETIEKPVYITVYQPVVEEVPVYIYQTINVPEYIYQTIIEKEIVNRTVYEKVYVTVHDTVEETVHDTVTVTRDPTEDEIKDYISSHETEILQLIKDDPDFEELVKEYIRENPSAVIGIIKQDPDWENILKDIIQDIPPEELITYLTDEQISYIIQQQPPQVILQTITIIDIEYIIFAGNANVYNGPPGPGGNTPLTSQEISSNTASVNAMAQALKDHPDYLIMLHGHANPVDFSNGETVELKQLSEDRANSVEAALRTQFKAINDGVDIDNTRVSVSGYGGEKVLFSNNSAYTALNRRVEMILIRVGVDNTQGA